MIEWIIPGVLLTTPKNTKQTQHSNYLDLKAFTVDYVRCNTGELEVKYCFFHRMLVKSCFSLKCKT